MDQMFRMQTVARLAQYYDAQLGRTAPADLTPASPSRASQASDGFAAMISSYTVLIDPEERERFKASKPGIRKGDRDKAWIALAPVEAPPELIEEYRKRRSYRRFSLRPVPFDAISRLLSYLRPLALDGQSKYLYASPGGLYPTQVYLHCKPGRVGGLDAGVYYYHPIEHRLILLQSKVEISRDIHIPFINTPIYDEAAFSLFFVCEFAALAPGYGERSLHFATMEAGIMTHLLESRAYQHGIGLCSIGTIDFEQIRAWFDASASQVLIHSMVGGRIEERERGREQPEGHTASLQERIQELSAEEVSALLKAHKEGASKG
jgi:SagB-type dehydrogenase family enzyme